MKNVSSLAVAELKRYEVCAAAVSARNAMLCLRQILFCSLATKSRTACCSSALEQAFQVVLPNKQSRAMVFKYHSSATAHMKQ